MEPPKTPKNKEARYSRRIKTPQEKTVFNMTVYDMETMHQIRNRFHDLFFESVYPNRVALFQSERALRQFFKVFKSALPYDSKKNVEKKFVQFKEKYDKFRYTKFISMPQYDEIVREIDKLEDMVYLAKHRIGLGFLTEKTRDADTLLEEALI